MLKKIVILLLFISKISFCQDILVLKDSTRLQVSLIEINQQFIKYKELNTIVETTNSISKSDVSYVKYQNGMTEVIPNPQIINLPSKIDNSNRKLNNYVNFNLQAGVVINNSYCNKPRKDDFPPSHTSYAGYYGYSKKNNVNINLGFNFVLGSNPYIKHIIGVNYLRSKGEFNYYYSGVTRSQLNGYEWRTFSEDLRYYSTIDYLNFVTGLRFTICKKFHLEPCIAINRMANSSVKVTGYKETTDYNTHYLGLAPLVQYNYLENETYKSDIESTVSFCPKVTYEFKIKEQKVGIYYSYNLGISERLPWNLIGFTYYPFKILSK